MKTKTIKYKGFYVLVCADKFINEKYGCTEEHPITLATMSNFEMTKCWKIRDMRLEETFYPSPHLEGSNTQTYTPVDAEDAQKLKDQLRYYKVRQNGDIQWSTFCGMVGMGDLTDHPDNPAWLDKGVEGYWSFSAARTIFKQINDFWKNFEGDDLKTAMIINPHRQISEFDYKFSRGDYSSKKKTKSLK